MNFHNLAMAKGKGKNKGGQCAQSGHVCVGLVAKPDMRQRTVLRDV